MVFYVIHFDLVKRDDRFYLIGKIENNRTEEYYLDANNWEDAEIKAKELYPYLKKKHPDKVIAID